MKTNEYVPAAFREVLVVISIFIESSSQVSVAETIPDPLSKIVINFYVNKKTIKKTIYY